MLLFLPRVYLPMNILTNDCLFSNYKEAKSVAQQQIVDAMLKDYDPTTMTGNTLHSDATSKFFKHYESFQVTLPVTLT
jgi:hypothetical protein